MVKKPPKRKTSRESLNSRGKYKSRVRFFLRTNRRTVSSISSGYNASVKQKLPNETANEHLSPIIFLLYRREHPKDSTSPMDFCIQQQVTHQQFT